MEIWNKDKLLLLEQRCINVGSGVALFSCTLHTFKDKILSPILERTSNIKSLDIKVPKRL